MTMLVVFSPNFPPAIVFDYKKLMYFERSIKFSAYRVYY